MILRCWGHSSNNPTRGARGGGRNRENGRRSVSCAKLHHKYRVVFIVVVRNGIAAVAVVAVGVGVLAGVLVVVSVFVWLRW